MRHHIACLFLLLLFFLPGSSGLGEEESYPATQYSREENLRIWSPSSSSLPTLYHISQTCFAEVRKFLRGSRPMTELNLYFSSQAVSGTLNPFASRITLCQNDSPEKIYSSLIAAALGRHIEENCRGKDRNIPSLAWICAGLYHRIYYDGKGFTLRYTPDFRIAREQFDQGFYPSLNLLISHPVPPERTRLYQLYSLYCDIFLKVLEDQEPRQQTVLRNFLEFQSFNRPQMDTLQLLLKKKLGTDDLDFWYRKQMYEQSGKGIRKAQAETIARQLREIITVPFIDKDRPGEITYRPIYELPSRQLTEEFLSSRRIRLAQLHLRAPLLMQDAIFQFTRALDRRSSLRIQKEYDRALASFKNAYRKQKAAEDFLKQYEKNISGKLGAFADDWEIIQHYQELREELLQAVDSR